MRTTRQAEILRLLVGSYIETASPVSSMSLVRRGEMPMSSATVRNDLAELEAEGYVARPHTSAGVVPTEKGYRYYVESLSDTLELPESLRRTIRHQFHQVEREEERWMRLAATTLAQIAVALAIVTPPRTAASRLRLVDLVPVDPRRALLILVLDGGRLSRMMVQLPEPVPPEALEREAHRLTARHAGRTPLQIGQAGAEGSPLGTQVREAVLYLMDRAEGEAEEEPYLYGFTNVLNQPEFLGGGLIRSLLEAMETGRLLLALHGEALSAREVRVVIGHEHAEDFLHPYGLVVGAYGAEADAHGTVAVLGPTRMDYASAISSVRYVSGLLSELAVERVPGVGRTPAG